MSNIVVLNMAHSHKFCVAAGSNTGLLLYKSSIFEAWPKLVKVASVIYEFEGATTVPVDLQTRYAGAANYTRKDKCGFDEAWIGKCDKPLAKGSTCCETHTGKECVVCKQQATRTCPATMGLVCGTPTCDSEMCKIKHDLGHVKPSIDTREHLEYTFAYRVLGECFTKDQFEEVIGFFISNSEKYIAALVKLDRGQDLAMQESKNLEYFKEYVVKLRACFENNKEWPRESTD